MVDNRHYMSIISIVRMIKNSYRLDDNLIIKRKEGRKMKMTKEEKMVMFESYMVKAQSTNVHITPTENSRL